MDAVADRKDTMLDLMHNLHTKFIAGKSRDYLVNEGDQKFYEILQELKCEYGNLWSFPCPQTGIINKFSKGYNEAIF